MIASEYRSANPVATASTSSTGTCRSARSPPSGRCAGDGLPATCHAPTAAARSTTSPTKIAGRVTPSKSCDELFDLFATYKALYPAIANGQIALSSVGAYTIRIVFGSTMPGTTTPTPSQAFTSL